MYTRTLVGEGWQPALKATKMATSNQVPGGMLMTDEIIVHETNHTALERHANDDIELYVDHRNMVAFATTKGLARICDVKPGSIRHWARGEGISPISAEVQTAGGIQGVKLLSYKDGVGDGPIDPILLGLMIGGLVLSLPATGPVLICMALGR